MQHGPAPSAHPADPSCRGGERQRNHQYEAREAHRDVAPLQHVRPDAVKIEDLVKRQVHAEVAASIKKREQSQLAPEADQLRLPKNFAQRRNSQSDGYETQRPIPRGVFEKLRGIRAESTGERFPDQHAQGDETNQEYKYLCPFTSQYGGHGRYPFSNFS